MDARENKEFNAINSFLVSEAAQILFRFIGAEKGKRKQRNCSLKGNYSEVNVTGVRPCLKVSAVASQKDGLVAGCLCGYGCIPCRTHQKKINKSSMILKDTKNSLGVALHCELWFL